MGPDSAPQPTVPPDDANAGAQAFADAPQSTLRVGPHPADVIARQRAVLVRFVRIVFAILVVTFTMLAILRAASESKVSTTGSRWWIPAVAAGVLVILVTIIERLTAFKKIATLSGVMFGVLAGLLATLAVGGLIDLLMQSWVPETAAYEWVRPVVDSTKIIVGVCLSYLGVVTVLQTQDDFRLVIPYVEFSKQMRGVRPVLLDTSALIDGRVIDLAGTHFLQFPIVIPRCVIQELQQLADSADALRRARGRRGLDAIVRLQRLGTIDVTIDESSVPGKGVDQMLVELARVQHASIMTTDSALQRVAGINSIRVLNLHELSLAAKPPLAHGDELDVRILRAGEHEGQGAGYLDDGTLVVVEDGASRIGTVERVSITGSLQTSAGRMFFARIVGDRSHDRVSGRSATPSPAEIEPVSSVHDERSAGENMPQVPRADGPFPPRPPRSIRAGSPRNPRR